MPTAAEILGAAIRTGQLRRSQYWSEDQRRQYDEHRIRRTLAAAQRIPFYRAKHAEARGVLPVLRRAELADLVASVRRLHPGRLLAAARSSGSTGTPAEFIFDHRHERGRYGAWGRFLTTHGWHPLLRSALVVHLPERRRRGLLLRLAAHLGFSFESSFVDFDAQWRWLQDRDPQLLLTPPSNLEGLLDARRSRCERLPSLRRIICASEVLSDELRQRTLDELGVAITDAYGATEASIAWQCPAGSYHTNDEHVRVELLDDEDQPVAAGQLGRVVLTTLENELMPLVRYDIGDYARAATGPCACGRTLSTIGPIVGRSINLFRTVDGRRITPWQLVVFVTAHSQVRGVQIVQCSAHRWCVRYVATEELSLVAKGELVGRFRGVLGAVAEIEFERVVELRRSPGGKFMAAINEYDAEPSLTHG